MSTRLCRLDELTEGSARGFRIPETESGRGRERRILVWRQGSTVRAYVNRCPHRGTPLDWAPDHFMDAERLFLVCATHGARFRPVDGHCVSGPCAGDGLEPVAVEVRDGVVYAV